MRYPSCPVCGENFPESIPARCPECGAVVPVGMSTPPPEDFPEEPIEPPQPPPINEELTDELLQTFREQFEKHHIRAPREWSERLRLLAREVEPSRRMATVFFVDLRGYTALTGRLGEAQFNRLHQWFYGLCTRHVELHGGFIVRFMGDAVYAAFGAPWAFERDAEEAVKAMIGIREEIRAAGPFEGEELSIRGGANTGVVNVQPIDIQGRPFFDLFGSTVNLAARLQDHAKTWDLVVSDTLAEQIDGLFEMEALEPFRPKNYPRDVTPHAVVRHYGSEAKRRADDLPLAGRAAELERIRFAARLSMMGEFNALRVTGEAGVGKTRLLREGIAPLRSGGFTMLWANCEPSSRFNLLATALQWIRGLAHQLAGEIGLAPASPSSLLQVLTARLPELEPWIVPSLGYALGIPEQVEKMRSMNGDHLRHQVVAAIASLFTTACQEKPITLIVDDLQWCDVLSAEVIARLMETRPGGILILSASRLPEPGASAGPAQAWDELHLGVLDHRSRNELLASVLGADASDPVVARRILDQSEGIPLYLIEMARETQRPAGEAPKPSESPTSVPGLPLALIEILQARIDRLSVRRRSLLQCGAVIGRRFTDSIISLFNQFQDDLLDELIALKGLRMLRDEPLSPEVAYAFTPAVIRDVAYQMLTVEQRQALHRFIAERIEQRYGDRLADFAFDLAWHWQRAGEAVRARRHLRRAARQAIERGEPQAAYELISDGLTKLTQDAGADGDETSALSTQQRSLLEDLAGQAARMMGKLDAADEHFARRRELAERTGNPEWVAEADYQIGVNRVEQARYEDAVESMNRAMTGCRPDSPLRFRATNALGAVHLRRGRLEESLAHFERIIKAMGDGPASALLGDAWGNAGIVHWQLGDLEKAQASFRQAMAIWRAIGNPFGQIHSLSNQGLISEKQGRFFEARGLYAAAGDLAETEGYLRGITTVEANLGNVCLLFQDWDGARRHSIKAQRAAALIGHRYSEAVALENIGLALHGLGFSEEARESLASALRIGEQTGDPTRTDSARLGLAWIDLLDERLDQAAQHLCLLSDKVSPELQVWRELIEASIQGLRNPGALPELFETMMDDGRARGTVEDLLRVLDALKLMSGRKKLPWSADEIKTRRSTVINAIG